MQNHLITYALLRLKTDRDKEILETQELAREGLDPVHCAKRMAYLQDQIAQINELLNFDPYNRNCAILALLKDLIYSKAKPEDLRSFIIMKSIEPLANHDIDLIMNLYHMFFRQ